MERNVKKVQATGDPVIGSDGYGYQPIASLFVPRSQVGWRYDFDGTNYNVSYDLDNGTFDKGRNIYNTPEEAVEARRNGKQPLDYFMVLSAGVPQYYRLIRGRIKAPIQETQPEQVVNNAKIETTSKQTAKPSVKPTPKPISAGVTDAKQVKSAFNKAKGWFGYGGKMNYIDFFKPGGTVNPVLDAASYMIPIYGTYRSIKDAIAEPTWQNIGLAGASALGDALTVFGVGAGIKSGVAGVRAAKAAKTLTKAASTAHATASNLARISDRAAKAATKTKQAVNAATLLPEATQSQIIALQRRASAASDLAQQANAASKASAEIPTTLFNRSAVKAAEAARKTNQATQWYKAAGATTLGSSAFDAAGQSFKNGGGIHIKKKNRGKFTASAEAAGESVQEHANKLMNDPNATPLQKKRANFAIQSKRWSNKHQTGGKVFMGATKVNSYDSAPLIRLWDFVSNFSSKQEPEKLTITSTVTPKDQDFSGYTLLGTPIRKSNGKMHQDLADLQNLFIKYNLPVKITSGYREGAITSNGSRSFHATGEAMDIVPTDGHSFQEIADIIRNTPEIANFMRSHQLGVLDETSKEMLAKTGGTGAHYHIGRDKIAQKFWI